MKTKIKNLAMALFLSLSAFAQDGALVGTIKDDQGETVIGAILTLSSGGSVVGKSTTDVQGEYAIKPLFAGKYEMLIQYTGYKTKRVKNITIKPNQTERVDLTMETNTLGGEVVVETTRENKVIDQTFTTMESFDARELGALATDRGSINGAIMSRNSDIQQAPDGQLYSRGARAGTMTYFIDGEKAYGSYETPAGSVQNLTVITGGIPAQFGDVTGGVIIIETKSYFTGIRDKNIANAEYNERKRAQKQAEAATPTSEGIIIE